MNQSGLSAQSQGGLLKAVLRSTLLKDLIRVKMSAIHPDSGRYTVKTLLGEDPEVFFGITSGLPVIVNSVLGALTELAVQLKDKYSPELLKSFMSSLLDDINGDAARKCCKAWADLASVLLEISPELKEKTVRTLLTDGPMMKAGAINAFARFVNGITRDDPQAFRRFVSRVMENVDGEELGKAAAVMANALLDQKWHLASWTFNLVKGRMKNKFGRIRP
jgi:hypothetical protein